MPSRRRFLGQSHAEITRAPGELTLTWTQLRSNRDQVARPSGNVSGTVRLRAAPDGRSAILSAKVSNHSQGVSGQILFPDLRGLRPFDAPERMELRMAMGVINPFAGDVPGRSPFYPSALRLRLCLPDARSYRVRYSNEQGQTSPQVSWSGRGDWSGTTRRLRPLELAFFEVSVA
jgi:hypothetical protein